MVLEIKREPFQKRFDDMVTNYQVWKTIHQDLSKYILPTRGNFDTQPNKSITIDYKTMLDGRPQVAAGILAAGMQTGMTSQASQWFRLGFFDPDLNDYQPAREWLDDVQQKMMAVFARSNIYQSFYANYEELGVFGTDCLIIEPDYENIIRTSIYTCGEYYYDIDQYGLVNSFCRYFYMSVENLIATFGKENVSRIVKDLWNKNQLKEMIKCCHLIEPNDGRDPNKRDNKNMAYRSVYWIDGADKDEILSLGGFDDFPVLGCRWGVRTTAEAYGRGSPGWKTLGDSRTLQEFNKDFLAGFAKMANPPLQVVGDISSGVINALPGAKNVVSNANGNAGILPLYQVNFPIDQASNEIMRRQYNIDVYFYVDLFKMISSMSGGPRRTATEIAERHEEKLMVLSPVLDRIEAEKLDKVIDLTFKRMLKTDQLPPVPQELEGQELKVEYISMLAQAQKMIRTKGVDIFAGFIGSLAAVKPEILDKFNADKAADVYADYLGVEPEIINSEEKVTEIRQQRAQQMAQQQQMEQAGAMVQGAKVLSDTNTGGDNALTALLGGMMQ